MVLLPPGFAAFQNCFCAEYLFIGQSLNRQSEEAEQEDKVKEQEKSSPYFIGDFSRVSCIQLISIKDHFF